MQPLGRKPCKFPSKRDCHPKKPNVNWWEFEICSDGSNKSHRQKSKRKIIKEIDSYYCNNSKIINQTKSPALY